MLKMLRSTFTILLAITFIVSSVFALDETIRNTEIGMLGDTEGQFRNIDTMIENGFLVRRSDGTLDFPDNRKQLLFLGDLPDRGPDAIEVRDALVALKERYPNRVDWIIGNRDSNKLMLLRDKPALQKMELPAYKNWLVEEYKRTNNGLAPSDAQLKSFNKNDKQLSWWFNNQGAGDALRFHQEGLSKKLGRPVSLSDAADDMVKQLSPGGIEFEYLKKGQMGLAYKNAHSGKSFVATHAGVTKQNFLRIPGVSEPAKNVKDWFAKLEIWKNKGLAEMEAGRVNSPVARNLMAASDAVWDPVANAVMFREDSTTYTVRVKEDGSVRTFMDPEVAEQLKREGYFDEFKGHTPQEGVVKSLPHNNGVVEHFVDTSFAHNGGSSYTVWTDRGVHFSGTNNDGVRVSYLSLSGQERLALPETNPNYWVGHIFTDEEGKMFTINGQTDDGRILMTRYDGYDQSHVFTSLEEIRAAKAAGRMKLPVADTNTEILEQQRAFRRGLDSTELADSDVARTLRPIDPETGNPRKPVLSDIIISREAFESGAFLEGRRPVLISGASELSFVGGNEQDIQKVAADLLRGLDPTSDHIIFGGTTPDDSFEKAFVEEARKRGFKITGTPISQATPSQVPRNIDSLVVIGDDWDEMLKPVVRWTARHGGSAVFLGGGGIIRGGVQEAADVGLDYHMYRSAEGASLDGINQARDARLASRAAGTTYTGPNHDLRGFTTGEELAAKLTQQKVGVMIIDGDPVTKADLEKARLMKIRAGLDKVVIAINPNVPAGGATYEQRLAMLDEAIKGETGIISPDAASRKTIKNMDGSKGIIELFQGKFPNSEINRIIDPERLQRLAALPENMRPKNLTYLLTATDTLDNLGLPSSIGTDIVRPIPTRPGLLASPPDIHPAVQSFIRHNKLYGYSGVDMPARPPQPSFGCFRRMIQGGI